jgi:hypothetical protein
MGRVSAGSVPQTPTTALPARFGPWGSRLSSPAEAWGPESPRVEPRLNKAQAPAPIPTPTQVLETPADRQRSIGVAVAKPASQSTATIAAREAAKTIFGSGRKGGSGLLVGIVRSVLGSLVK